MKVLMNMADTVPDVQGGAVTIGNFDGLHLGHRALIGSMVGWAEKEGLPSAILTFEPHPVKILHPERVLKELFPLADLIEQCSSVGVSALVIHPFDLEFSRVGAEEFVASYLVKYLKPRHVFVGHDFRFGRGRSGDFQTFKKLGQQYGFDVSTVSAFDVGGLVVSSSKLRECLVKGDVETATKLLGRPFELRGKVVDGDKRGRDLGYPTANMHVDNEVIPLVGVYITELVDQAQVYPAVTNVGYRPTFQDGASINQLKVETFVLDEGLNLYSHEIRVRFLKRIREEKKFASAEELVSQINQDVATAREYFRRHV